MSPQRQGIEAHYRGEELRSNPYPPESRQNREWERGWLAAQADFYLD